MKFQKRLLAAIAGLVACAGAAFATPTAFNYFTPPNPYAVPLAALSADLAWTATDTTNGNAVASTGREVLLVWNTDTVSHTVTISSSADSLGRTGDITAYAEAATTISCFGPFPVTGFKQTDGTLHVTSSSALVKFAVIHVPTSI